MTHDLGILLDTAFLVGLAALIVAFPIIVAVFGTKGGRS